MRKIAHIAKRLCFLAVLLWALAGILPSPQLYNRAGFSQAIFDRNRNLLRLTLSNDDKYRLWVSLREIPETLINATLTQEDRYFYYHYGVNPIALTRAAFSTFYGGHTMGASTITMQLARMSFGLNTKTISGKLLQIIRALQIERAYSKGAILEAYLNLAPYGGNIEGVGSASWVYFGKAVSQVSEIEGITLSVLPQSPSLRNPVRPFGIESLGQAQLRLAQRIQGEKLRPAELALGFNSKSALPNRAPHLTNRLVAKYSDLARVYSTLDLRLQSLIEKQSAQFVERNRRLGMENTDVLVVDSRSMEALGYLGSADFGSQEIFGQVDGVRGMRSPGSALKPFIYALALDQGLITPQSMLKDTSLSISSYNPENYDRDFLGPISATDALIRSRNIPAIQLANQLHAPSLYDFLKDSGLTLKSEDFYGLALALGGAELSMEDLVTLYAALANHGLLQPIRYVLDSPQTKAKSILSPESAYLTLQMLKQNPRPHEEVGQTQIIRTATPWKTGTSFGFRDAWAIGIVGPYVVGVWIGNFDGRPNPNFIGRDAAGPLFFSIADALSSEFGARELSPVSNLNIRPVKVCALTGALPGPSCPHLKQTLFIPGKSPIKTCNVHREILVDTRTGLRECERSSPYVRPEVFEFWPSDIEQVLRQAGIHTKLPPQFSAHCLAPSSKGAAPLISSPIRNVTYQSPLESWNKPNIPFSAVTDGDAQKLFWFVDNNFVGESRPGETFFWSGSTGEHLVGVTDDLGRSNHQELKVGVLGGNS